MYMSQKSLRTSANYKQQTWRKLAASVLLREKQTAVTNQEVCVDVLSTGVVGL